MNGCITVLCDRGSSYYVLYGIIIYYVFITYYVLCIMLPWSKRARSGLASNAKRVLQRCRRVQDSMHPVLYVPRFQYLVELYRYCVCTCVSFTRKKENGSSRAGVRGRGECRRVSTVVRGGASSDQRTHEPPDRGRWAPTPLSRVRRRPARLSVQVAHRRPPTLPHTPGRRRRALSNLIFSI